MARPSTTPKPVPPQANFHEALPAEEGLVVGSDRSFGMVMAVAGSVVGLLPLLKGGAPRLWALGFGLVALTLAGLRPSWLRPFNVAWMRLGAVLNRIVSPLVLGFLFFVVLTPMGLYQRARGRDLLRLRLEPQSPSYWIAREPPGPTPESMGQQF